MASLGTTPNTFTFNPNSNGGGNEFSLLVQKRVFQGASPGPSPTPIANVWTFNAFTTQASGGGQFAFFDSLGPGGPVDPQFVSPRICMTEPFDNTYYAYYTAQRSGGRDRQRRNLQQSGSRPYKAL